MLAVLALLTAAGSATAESRLSMRMPGPVVAGAPALAASARLRFRIVIPPTLAYVAISRDLATASAHVDGNAGILLWGCEATRTGCISAGTGAPIPAQP